MIFLFQMFYITKMLAILLIHYLRPKLEYIYIYIYIHTYIYIERETERERKSEKTLGKNRGTVNRLK